MILERFGTFSLKDHYYPAYHIGEDCSDWTVPTLWNSLYETFYNVVNSIICCAKEARASIVLNIEWVQFVLKNCAKLHSVRGLYDKKQCLHVYLGCDVQKVQKAAFFSRHQICWQDFVRVNLSNTKFGLIIYFASLFRQSNVTYKLRVIWLPPAAIA